MSQPADSALDERLVSTEQAARILNVSTRYLELLRVRGGGPPFISLSVVR
jgi:hypothetical protein